MFEKIDQPDSSFSLRSLSNGLFVKALPPASGSALDPFRLSVSSVAPGATERFFVTQSG